MADISYIKTFAGISNSVNGYDDLIIQLRDEAIGELKLAGLSSDEKNPQVKAYIETYCRLHMISEPNKNFIDSEESRLLKIARQLQYGG
ncbi:MAG: hypothetical protein ACRCZN_01965 [Lactococcus lactis]